MLRLRPRPVLLACVIPLVLAAAGSAPATPGPAAQLVVYDQSATSELAIRTWQATDAARLTLYVPAGYRLRLDTPPGTLAGSTSFFEDQRGGILSVGELRAIDPASVPSDPACAPGAHAAAWVGSFPVHEGQRLMVRIYADPTSAEEESLGAYRLVACVPSPDASPGQDGAVRGVRLRELDLFGRSSGVPVIANPAAAGTSTWRLLVTPYAAGTATPDPAATFEVRTRTPRPHALTVHAAYSRAAGAVRVWGRLLALGRPRRGVRVTVDASAAGNGPSLRLGVATTRADGTYVVRKRLAQKRRARTFEVLAYVDSTHGPCGEPTTVAAGCVDETVSPPPDVATKVRIPRLGP